MPDYIEPPGQKGPLWDGPYQVDLPRDVGADRREISRVYMKAFQQADGMSRKKVLRSYATNFPHLAFDSDGWLWPLWQEWRSAYSRDDQRLLSALASGIRAKGQGWMSGARSRAWRLKQAQTRLSTLRSDEELAGLYKDYLEGVRSPDREVRAETKRRYLPRLIQIIKEKTGYPTDHADLARRRLSSVLLIAVSRRFGVRERDLHGAVVPKPRRGGELDSEQ
jgi:hypothetical protein